MTAGRDDDALSWSGDDDPTLEVGSGDARAGSPGLPDGWNAVGRGSDALDSDALDSDALSVDDAPAVPATDAEATRASMGNAELISLGVLGGFSLLYAVGWLIGGLRLQVVAEFLVAPVAYQVSLWLAVLAPLVWFTTVCLLTAGSRAWVRFAWLAGGVVLLLPWPFIMVGVIGR
ncbi:MAG: DNA polymerase III subunit gamma/tau [Microbacterium sp.]